MKIHSGKIPYLWLPLIQSNALNRSNNIYFSLRAHRFLSYHLIQLPCPVCYVIYFLKLRLSPAIVGKILWKILRKLRKFPTVKVFFFVRTTVTARDGSSIKEAHRSIVSIFSFISLLISSIHFFTSDVPSFGRTNCDCATLNENPFY